MTQLPSSMYCTPAILYRVFDQYSATEYDPDDGFRAADQSFTFTDWQNSEKMAPAIRLHIDWKNRAPTPFISISTSRSFAQGEAMRRQGTGRQDVRVAEIFSSELGKSIVSEQLKTLTVRHGVVASNSGTAEYLCLLHIPRSAIKKVWKSSDFDYYCKDISSSYWYKPC
jgi:hypothetical protein